MASKVGRRIGMITWRVPAPLKAAAKATAARLDPLYVWAYRRRTGEKRPIPPVRTRGRVTFVSGGVSEFFASGARVAGSLLITLDHIGRPFERFESVLDFGCGPARVLQHLQGFGPKLHGCDVDGEAISWAKRHHPGIRFEHSAPDPPLPFDTESFDLIYAISVLTHLSEDAQDVWLRELDRVLAPDGIALVTVLGEQVYAEPWTRSFMTNSAEQRGRLAARGPLAEEGFVFEPYSRTSWNEGDLSHTGESYGIAFHSEDYIRDKWSQVFDVGHLWPGVINSVQDLVLLQKRSGSSGDGRPA